MTQLDLQQRLEQAEAQNKELSAAVVGIAKQRAEQERIAISNFEQCIKLEIERDDLQQQVNALAAENLALKSGHQGFFSYGSDSGFEEHESAEKAIAAAESDIDYYRGDACDGWSEETDQTVWGVIMQRATMTGLRPKSEEDSVSSYISEVCDYKLLPNIETPATDAIKRQWMAEGALRVASKITSKISEKGEPNSHYAYAYVAVNLAAQLRQPEEKCETCCGRGEIGGFISAESGYEVSLCPDCQPEEKGHE